MDLLPPGLVGAFGLFLARTSALVITSPLLGLLVGPSSVKVALIGALSLVSFTVAGGCVCFPSSWSLQESTGKTLDQVHGVVPELNRHVTVKVGDGDDLILVAQSLIESETVD